MEEVQVNEDSTSSSSRFFYISSDVILILEIW